jgi:hypothetical protein
VMRRGWSPSSPGVLGGSSDRRVKTQWLAWARYLRGKDSRLSSVFGGNWGTSFEAPGRDSTAGGLQAKP